MLGVIFSLSLLMIFMLAVMLNDLLILLAETRSEIEKHFSHDTLIVHDHAYDPPV